MSRNDLTRDEVKRISGIYSETQFSDIQDLCNTTLKQFDEVERWIRNTTTAENDLENYKLMLEKVTKERDALKERANSYECSLPDESHLEMG